MITNPTGMLSDSLTSIVDAMVGSGRVQVAAVFAALYGQAGVDTVVLTPDTALLYPGTGLFELLGAGRRR